MMPESVIWAVIVVVGLLTVSLRASLIVLAGRREMPPLFLRALRFVPPAVLAALIFPGMLLHSATVDLPWGALPWLGWLNERTLAAVVGAVVMWRSKNVLLTIVVGMVALWALQLLL